MVKERLIPKKATYQFPSIRYEGGLSYRITSNTRTFYSTHEYWYDDRKFLLGKFQNSGIGLIDVGTYAWAVQPNTDKNEFVAVFKKKLQTSGKTIHEVVRDYLKGNLDIELWVLNSLSI